MCNTHTKCVALDTNDKESTKKTVIYFGKNLFFFTIENFVFRISQSLLYEYDFLALADRNRGLRDMQNTLIFTKIGKYVMKQDDKSILKL